MFASGDAIRVGEALAQREFELLYRRSSRSADNWAYRLLGNVADAEDVAQEALARAWRHVDHYARGRPFESWLHRIVFNLAMERRRQYMKVSFYSLDALVIADATGRRIDSDLADCSADPESLALSEEF